jgi:hypothetical protein
MRVPTAAAAALIVASALCAGFLGGARHLGSPALATDSIDNVAIDMNPAGNTNSSIGPIDTCVSISTGASAGLDIVLGPAGIPASSPANGFYLTLNSSPQVEVTYAHALSYKFGQGLIGFDDPIPPDGDGQFDYAYVRSDSTAFTGPGTIARINLHSTSSTHSVTNLTLTSVAIFDPSSNSLPIQNIGSAQIAINAACGTPDPDGDTLVGSSDNCPFVANHNQADTDGDGYGDACEQPQCVTVVSHWMVPPGDSDCDGFTDALESFAGTGSTVMCAATSAADDESGPDAWPVDFNDDQGVNVLDVSQYSSRFNSSEPGPPYDARHDLNADGHINVLDVSKFSSVMSKSCTP